MEWRYRCLRCRLWTTEAVTSNHPTAQRALCKACCHRALREFWDLYDERDVIDQKETTMAKGSALERVLKFFREEDIDVCDVAYQLIGRTIRLRVDEAKASRARQVAAASTPRKSRTRKSPSATAPVATGTAPTSGGEAQAAVAGA